MKISIIMPVYNVEKYIRQCLESVSSQTYEDYEVIVVDDGSPDQSIDIINEYCSFPNLKLIRQKNSGIARAREAGLIAATGDFIWFVDSDDFIAPDALDVLSSALDKDVDLLEMCSLSFLDGDPEFNQKQIPGKVSGHGTGIINMNREQFRQTIVMNDIVNGKRSCLMWNKIYKKELIQKFVTNQTANMTLEDYSFNCQYYCGVSNYRKIENILYYYRDRPGSITKKIDPDIQNILGDIVDIQKNALHMMDMWSEKTETACAAWYLCYFINALRIGYRTHTFTEQNLEHMLSKPEVLEKCQMVYNSAYDTKVIKMIRDKRKEAYCRYFKMNAIKQNIYDHLRHTKMAEVMIQLIHRTIMVPRS